MAKMHSGGGRTPAQKSTRTGSSAHGINHKHVAQVGLAREPEAIEPRRTVMPAGGAVQLGNAKALDVNRGGPGVGRTIYRSGSQGFHNQEPAPPTGQREAGHQRIPEPRRAQVKPGPLHILRSYGGEIGRGRR
jgi:hypothetical protein